MNLPGYAVYSRECTLKLKHGLTVAPGADVKVEDTWNFFIVISVRGGHGE